MNVWDETLFAELIQFENCMTNDSVLFLLNILKQLITNFAIKMGKEKICKIILEVKLLKTIKKNHLTEGQIR